MAPEAQRWVKERLAFLEKNDQNIVIVRDNSAYDPVGMNFKKVKDEATMFA